MVSEKKITSEIDRWIDRKRVISDSVALELFQQYRGPSSYLFAGVSADGVVDDARGLLSQIEDIIGTLQTATVTGDGTRYRELSALKGWVLHWVATHGDAPLKGDVAVTRENIQIETDGV